MKEKKTKITFPFEPSERVKAAFRQEVAYKETIRIMTETLFNTATEIMKSANPWAILIAEHPEFADGNMDLTYNYRLKAIDIKVKEKP